MKLNEEIKIEIDFSNLGEIYSGNPNDFILILKKIQQEYSKYLDLLVDQILTENMDDFRKTRHKISATLLLLKLDHFHEYLSFLKEYFAQGFSEKDEIILNLRKCFQEIQNNLSRKLTELEP